MTQQEPIKRAGTARKAERKLLRLFNHKSGIGQSTALILMVSSGIYGMASMTAPPVETVESAQAAAYTQQFRQEAAQLTRDIRSIPLVGTQEGLTVTPQERQRAAQIDQRARDLTMRIAFNPHISERTAQRLMFETLHEIEVASPAPSQTHTPVLDFHTRQDMIALAYNAAHRNEERRELNGATPSPQKLSQLLKGMDDASDTRVKWMVGMIFLGIPLGGAPILLFSENLARRRQRKLEQEERTERSYDTLQEIKKEMAPKTSVRVSYGKQP